MKLQVDVSVDNIKLRGDTYPISHILGRMGCRKKGKDEWVCSWEFKDAERRTTDEFLRNAVIKANNMLNEIIENVRRSTSQPVEVDITPMTYVEKEWDELVGKRKLLIPAGERKKVMFEVWLSGVFVYGDTYDIRDVLKKEGFSWDPQLSRWYKKFSYGMLKEGEGDMIKNAVAHAKGICSNLIKDIESKGLNYEVNVEFDRERPALRAEWEKI